MNKKVLNIPRFILLICFHFLIISCYSNKIELSKNIDNNEVAKKAIFDFAKRNKLFKENLVFNVEIYNPLNKKILKTVSKNEKKWINEGVYGNMIVVNIFGDNYYKNKYSTLENLSNIKNPNQFVEIENKLFIWFDPKKGMDENTNEILKKYGVLTNGNKDSMNIRDDAKKGTDYYFCTNNLNKYKIINTNIATGYYKPPKLNCK